MPVFFKTKRGAKAPLLKPVKPSPPPPLELVYVKCQIIVQQGRKIKRQVKADKLKTDVATASDIYDRIYYLVAVNLDRVKKALDKLPSDFLDLSRSSTERNH